jgi:hypothetical protein
MAGTKLFVDDVPLFAAEINGYLMSQVAPRFTTTAALLAAMTAGATLGQLAWADDTATLYFYNGTKWRPVWSTTKTWSPTWTGSTTNPQKGTSTESGSYRVAGPGLICASWRYLYNGTFNIGSGNYGWSLPSGADCDNDTGVPLGQATFFDTSAGQYFTRTAHNVGSASGFALSSEASVRSGSAAPVAPAAGDIYDIELQYRCSALDIV